MSKENVKLTRARDRSVPPPPEFDPSRLPDDCLLTTKELAGWLRLSLSTLEDWRLRHPERGPASVQVAGMPRYRVGDVRAWLVADQVNTSRPMSAPETA
ncbi:MULTISPECIES: helix-turn-helix transcriptional regulator [Bradyrhizobium]|uniref:helix-turn-helix transcriptional regulator n=1 Tax=Bradyrhizobium TaxID=374 RepID=UPI001EDBE3C2|nr:helix-turn-helix domain-containing protein [Bradyrhizobium zhengyangense]MCG2644290.1 helix-turn-helix domain-containing protein [Bradyrhizobium zhengyangense]